MPVRQRFICSSPTLRIVALLAGGLASALASSAPPAQSRARATAQDAAPAATRNYRPASGVLANPERGFYYMVDCDHPVSPALLKDLREQEGFTLVLCSVDLGPFIEARIDDATLSLFDRNMAVIRNAGMKAIVRFSYSADTSGKDTSLQWVDTHLGQLKPHLERNKDMIAVVQAGFIGGWGEWAYSRNFGMLGKLGADNWRDRKAVADKLLQAVPQERMVQLRTPDYKRRFAGAGPLDAAEAFNGSARARLAHHNDCFLASANDWGTYINRAEEYPYLEADTKFSAMGGETCNYAPERSNCPTALRELSKFHYSYLNAGYHPDVLRTFKEEGCHGEINRRLGYRFVIDSGIYPLQAKSGQAFPIVFTVYNEGWASPFNRRDVELVLRETAGGAAYRVRLPVDPRFWLAGQKHVVRQTVVLPADMPAGEYELLLNLPDPAPSLRGKPAFSIRFANEDIWEEATGFNRLNHIVRVGNPSVGHPKGTRARNAE